MIPRGPAALAVAVAVLVPLGALAQDDEEARARAAELYSQGETAYLEDRCTEALELFQQSYDLSPHVATRYNMALCHEELGHFAKAHALLAEVEQGDDPRLAESAREALARLSTKVARLRVEAEDVEVDVDGEPCEVPCERVLDPGEHEVVIGTGAEQRRRVVALAAGEARTIEFEQVRVEQENAPPPPPPPPPPARGRLLDRALLWGGAGLAVIGVAMTVVFGLEVSSLEDEVESNRAAGGDPGIHDDGENAALLANVGIAVGAVGLVAAGVGLYLGLGSKDGRDETIGIRLSPGGLVLATPLP